MRNDFYERWKKASKNEREIIAAKAAFNIDIEPATQRIVTIDKDSKRRILSKPPKNTQYKHLPQSMKEKLEADGVTVEVENLPRSTLSIVKASKGNKTITVPAMPESEGIIYAGTAWYEV